MSRTVDLRWPASPVEELKEYRHNGSHNPIDVVNGVECRTNHAAVRSAQMLPDAPLNTPNVSSNFSAFKHLPVCFFSVDF